MATGEISSKSVGADVTVCKANDTVRQRMLCTNPRGCRRNELFIKPSPVGEGGPQHFATRMCSRRGWRWMRFYIRLAPTLRLHSSLRTHLPNLRTLFRFFACLVASFLLGLILSIPTCAVFLFLIFKKEKTSKSNSVNTEGSDNTFGYN